MATRQEVVRLSLEDDGFSSKFVKDAAAVRLLNHELGNLNGTSAKASKSTDDLGRSTTRSSQSTRQASDDLNKYTGRMSLLVKSIAAVGPAILPISATAIPAVAGLTAGFGAAAAAAGVAVLAFNGVGDAVKAMDAYQLAPTADNLLKMQQAMDALGPAGAQFAKFIDGLEPQLHALQDAARGGLFPGVQEGIEELLPQLPKVQDFVSRLATEMGNLTAKAGKGLTNDPGFQKFFAYIDTEAGPILDKFATATGKVASGLTSLVVDAAPLTNVFTTGMLGAANAFQKWAAGLDQTDGFRSFVSYIQQEGPQVAALLKSVATTAIDIATAFAPIGSVTVPILTAAAKIIGTIAASPLGPVVAAFVSIGATMSLATAGAARLRTAWLGVATAATDAATAEEAAVAAGTGKGRLGKAGTVAAVAAIGASLIPTHPSESSDLTDDNLKTVGSKLSFVNPGIGGTGQGTINKLFGASDSITGIFGHTSDLSTERSAASGIDQQLSAMVSSGQTKKAADSFAIIEAAAKKSGASVEQVAAAFPQYSAAVKDASAANTSLGSSSDRATAAIRNLIAAQEAEHQTVLQNYDATTAFGQSMQALAKQAASGAKGFNQFTAAGAANRQSVSAAIEAYNGQSRAVKNSVSGYSQMTSKLIEFATKMGATKAQIAQFTSAIDKPKKLVVSADAGSAISTIRQLKAEIASLKGKTVTIRQNTILTTQRGAVKPQVHMPSADGSTVPKDNGPYGDRYPYLLAPGEEVISNRFGQADRFRPLLKAINAGRLADGGTASRRMKPLFIHEGPHWYQAAYKHNAPFAKRPTDPQWPYQTGLTAAQERKFEAWVNKQHVPFDMDARLTDYDMRGYWKKTKGKGWHVGSHFPDTFKTPYDTTFSHESKYATKNNPFYWHGNKLVDQRNGQVIFAANGGFISGPGGPREDRIPAWLSNGEFVMNAAATARLRPLLEHENAKGYAAGGRVSAGLRQTGYQLGDDPFVKVTDSLNKTATGLQEIGYQLGHGPFVKIAQQQAAASVNGVLGETKTKGAVGSMAKQIEDLSGKQLKKLGDAVDDLSTKRLGRLAKALDKASSTVSSRLDTATSNRDSLASTVASGLMPQLFQTGTGNPFLGQTATLNTAASLNATVAKATKQADQFGPLLKQAQAKGLTGAALSAVLSEGGIDGLRAFATAPAAQVRQFESGYNNLQHVVSADGAAAGNAIYGKQINSLQKELKGIRADLKSANKEANKRHKEAQKARAENAKKTGDAVGDRVNGAAANGKKKHPRGGK